MKHFIHFSQSRRNLRIRLLTATLLLVLGGNRFLSAQCNPDLVAPAAICSGMVVVTVPNQQVVTFQAESLDNGSADNCTAAQDLDFRIGYQPATPLPPATTELYLGQNELGDHAVVLWVIDQAGNATYCNTTVRVQDDCGGGGSAPAMVCNDMVYVYVPLGGATTFYPGGMLEGGPYCNTYGIRILSSPTAFSPSLTFTPAQVGAHNVQVRDNITNNSCWGTVIVQTPPVDCANDTTPPAANCAAAQVYLNEDGPGLTTVEASEINAGSYDLCTPPTMLQFAVERGAMPSVAMPSATTLDFTAIGTFNDVYLWVMDTSGNATFCQTQVQVLPPLCSPDVVAPVCIAPADTMVPWSTFNGYDVSNSNDLTTLLGDAEAWDNCNLQTVLKSVYLTYNACGQGSLISRSFIALDLAGNVSEAALQVVATYSDFELHLPKDHLPGDPGPIDSLRVLAENGTTLLIAYNDVVYDFDCDSLNDLVQRTWFVAYDCPNTGLEEVELPRLDLDENGFAGDGYDAQRGVDSMHLYVSGASTVGLTPAAQVYKYVQIIRYNFNDTINLNVEGVVFIDENDDCDFDSAEQGLEGWTVRGVGNASGREYFAHTDANGHYLLEDICTGDTEITVGIDAAFNYGQGCATTWVVAVNAGVAAIQNIPVQLDTECPLMEVSIGANFLRRCNENVYHVNYCNYSNQLIEDTYIEVELDSFMSYISSSIAATDLGNNRYRFETGDLAAGECGQFTLTHYLGCNAVLGQTHCTEAHLFPDTLCPQSQNWTGANIEVSAACVADSVYLQIKNTGAGDMSVPLDYIIVEDVIMLSNDMFQLNSGDVLNLPALAAEGKTWHLSAEQEPGHPYPGSVSTTIEGCAGLNSLGIAPLYSFENPNPFIAVTCHQNVSSFDPNDKQAFPTGYAESHFIERNTPVEYMIRFQNTGTDTAFSVVVLDTLSEFIDPASIRPGASSHAYTFDWSDDQTLRFTFDPISLPDSNVNWAASNGFVQFFARQKADLPLGTVIRNTASIYFDQNAPVQTNTVYHTIGENFIEVTSDQHEANQQFGALTVWPNPSAGDVLFNLEKGDAIGSARFTLFDLRGNMIESDVFQSAQYRFVRNEKPAGIYLYRIEIEGFTAFSGKLMLK